MSRTAGPTGRTFGRKGLSVMKFAQALVTLPLLLGAAAAHAQGQLYFPPGPNRGLVIGGDLGFGRGHGHLRLSGFLSGGCDAGYFNPGLSCVPCRPRVTSITSVTIYAPPSVIVVPPPEYGDLFPFGLPRQPLMEEPLPRQPVERPMPRADVPMPKADQPPPPMPFPEQEQPKQKQPQPPPAQQPRKPAEEFPPPPRPEADPRLEFARQVTLGKRAFAAGQYGRADNRFRQAIAANPADPMGYFLLAQTLFALAKYDDAVAAIHTGMRLRPDWPTSGFRPLELYEGNVADYPDHLARLETILAQNPNDPVLLFLYAYQLWFDGRQAEALPLFQQAAPLVPDRMFIDRFLQARPPGVPVI
jgi:Tetratricopeptide repeat